MALSHHQVAGQPSSNTNVEAAEPAMHDVNPGLAIVGQVAGGLLHDFNNILTVITGTIDILAEAVEDRPELAAVARLIDEAATRGARLTSQLLSFARGRPPRPCIVELTELLTDVGRLLRPTLGTEVEVTTSVAADVPAVFVDPGQLMAALLCLGITARNGMDGGGKIDIAAMRAGPHASDGGSDRDAVIVLRASAVGEGATRPEAMFHDIRMVEDFVRRSNGRLELKEPHGEVASVEISLPRADREPSSSALLSSS
ncbi:MULTISPECIES: histidine kinase dimerization/phospho-acceptor domain-containing protein [unclassified Bradyrhizobium]|uniref:histidine kinase dimerization/phospho-acceptor domain-containing protein n=1 Tax=unclassified Bradyrhizobium TaxID=2631580 RepID=UPI0028EF7DEC|nr:MULTISPECIES: histidine kinase dimerization/phospho-acceptor domain-containing protein [unclassified Bradyrhizobium]